MLCYAIIGPWRDYVVIVWLTKSTHHVVFVIGCNRTSPHPQDIVLRALNLKASVELSLRSH